MRPLLDDEQLLVVTWPDDDDMSSVLVVDAAGRLGWVALMALRGGP